MPDDRDGSWPGTRARPLRPPRRTRPRRGAPARRRQRSSAKRQWKSHSVSAWMGKCSSAAPRRRSAKPRIRFSARIPADAGRRCSGASSTASASPRRRSRSDCPAPLLYVRQHVGVLPNGALAATRLVERVRHGGCGEERQGDADEQREDPDAVGDDAREVQQQRAQDRHRQHVHQEAQRVEPREGRRGAAGPAQKTVQRRRARTASQDAEGRQVIAPVVEGRQFLDGPLAPRDLRCRRGPQQPAGQRHAAERRRRRPHPLEDRRAAEDVEIDRVGVTVHVDPRRRRCGRKVVPPALQPRRAACRDGTQRLEPLRPGVDARVNHHQHAEDREEQEREAGRDRSAIESHPPRERRQRGQKGREPRARETRPIAAAPRRDLPRTPCSRPA